MEENRISLEQFQALLKDLGAASRPDEAFLYQCFTDAMDSSSSLREQSPILAHMVSLAGLLEVAYQTPVLDYIHLLQVIQKLCKSPSDLLEGYRRMVFNVRIENKDDHGKNFSFLYDENEKRYRLSPAYDLTRTPFLYGHGRPCPGGIPFPLPAFLHSSGK